MQRKLWILPMAALLAVLLAFGAACGDDDDDSDTGGVTDATSAPTTSGGGDATSAPTTGGGGDTTPSAGGSGGNEIQISADNAEDFSTDRLTAPAGSVTIVFENQDDGVTHNFALYDSEDSAENLIAATDLLPGPSTDEITVEIEPGTYYYNCQVHPQMEGTLTAE